MGNRRIKVLIGITFSSLLICQIGIVPAYGAVAIPYSTTLNGEDFYDPIYNSAGFHINNTDKELLYYYGDNVNVSIPEDIEKVRYGAFSGQVGVNDKGRKIESIVIPRNIKEIGNSCFEGCTELTTVTISYSFPYSDNLVLRDAVFKDCTSLKTIDLSERGTQPGNRITSVGANLFEGCTSLTSVTLSENMTEITPGMFRGCTDLKYLKIPDNISSIDVSAFEGTADLVLYCKPGSPASKALDEYKEKYKEQNNTDSDVTIKYIDLTSSGKLKCEVEINLDENIRIEDGRIYCYLDDSPFYLNPKIKGDGTKIKFSSEYKKIAEVDQNGLVTISGVGSTYLYINVDGTNLFEPGFLKVPITVSKRGEDPVTPPDENPDDPDNPDQPDNPDNPGQPDQPVNPDDPNPNPGGGDSGQGGGNENTDPSQKEEQKINVKRIELTYGDAPFTIQPGSDMGKKVSFSSSNKKVFTVSSKGKITIKGCGLAKLKMTSKTSTKNFEIMVKPKKNSITTLEVKKRNITVKWKRDKKADGYYVYYATDSKFKKNVKKVRVPKNKTLQCTLKNLKSGKKYYVKLYSYKKSGKNMILSDASKTRNIKVK